MGVDPQPPTGLPPSELARWVQGQLTAWIEWSEFRRRRFRRSASLVRLLSFAFSVASTVILGLQDLNFWASLAFSLGAVGAAVGAVEPFFNWRARWVLMEESGATCSAATPAVTGGGGACWASSCGAGWTTAYVMGCAAGWTPGVNPGWAKACWVPCGAYC